MSRRTQLPILLLACLLLTGCPPPSASLLIPPEDQQAQDDLPSRKYHHIQPKSSDDLYALRTFYTPDSLNTRLSRSDVGNIEIRLLDDTELDVEAARVEGDSIIVAAEESPTTIALTSVERLVVRDKRTVDMFVRNIKFYGALTALLGGLAVANAHAYGEPQTVRDYGRGMAIGAGAGIALGTFGGYKTPHKETIFVNRETLSPL